MEFYVFLIYTLAYIGFFASSFYVISLCTFYRHKPLDRVATDKRVSILIPAYNEEKSIIHTLESALAITYPHKNLEIIVINDGSKDATLSLARAFASKHKELITVLTKSNGGKGTALNKGIAHATGEIIVSMDADSFVQPDALAKMVAFFSDPRVMAVTPSMGVAHPQGILQRIQHIEYYMGVFLRKSFATVNAIHITPGAFSAYRASFFKKYGGYAEGNITEDLEIALRIQSKGFIIENSPHSVVYTLAPSTFRGLLIQRRRWYSGLIRNLIAYKRLFGLSRGPLGTLVLPVAVSTVVLSVILTSYMVIKTLGELSDSLSHLYATHFSFANLFAFNSSILENLFLRLFSSPSFILGFFFISLLLFYLLFSRSQMKFTEGIKINFILFALLYSLLFSFWWIVSTLYVVFNRKVVWREDSHG